MPVLMAGYPPTESRACRAYSKKALKRQVVIFDLNPLPSKRIEIKIAVYQTG
jgi:hypothetical protein